MERKGQARTLVMQKSGWSGFSILVYILIGILVPILLLAHVFLDHPTYMKGYEQHAKTSFEAAIVDYEKEIKDLQAKIKTAETDIQDAEASVLSKTEKLQEVQASIAATNEKIEALSAQKDATAEEKVVLEQEKSVLEEQKTALEQEREELENALSVSEIQIDALREKINGFEEEITELENIQVAMKDLQAQRLAKEKIIYGLDEYPEESATVADLELEIADIEVGIPNRETAIADKQTEKTQLQADIVIYNTQIVDLNTDTQNKRDAITANRATITALNNEVRTLNTNKQGKTQTLNNVKQAQNRLQLQAAGIAFEIVALEIEMEDLQEQKALLDPTADADAIAQIDAQLADKQTQIAGKNTQLRDKYTQNVTHNSDIQNLQADIQNIQSEITDKNTQINNLNAQITGWNADIQNNTNTVARLTSNIATAEEKIVALGDEISALTEEIGQLQEEKIALRKTIDGLDPVADATEILLIEAQIADIDTSLQSNEQLKQEKINALLDAQWQRITDKNQAIEQKQTEFETLTQKEEDLSTQIQVESRALITLLNQESKTEKAITEANNTVTTLKLKKEANEVKVNALQENIAQIKENLKLSGNALAEKFYYHDVSNDYEYVARGAKTGLLGTTKAMVESASMGISNVQMVRWLALVVAVVAVILMTVRSVRKFRDMEKWTYEVVEDVIECKPLKGKGKKFLLTKGATVRVSCGLKGKMFGYGTITVAMGEGYAGEFSISNIKNAMQMRIALQKMIVAYGRDLNQAATNENVSFGGMPFPIIGTPFIPPMPPVMPSSQVMTAPCYPMQQSVDGQVYGEPIVEYDD